MALINTQFTESNLSLHERLSFDIPNVFEAEDALASAVDSRLSPEEEAILRDLYVKCRHMTLEQVLHLLKS